jgi:peptidoglycan hydrolase CwlO-like protein
LQTIAAKKDKKLAKRQNAIENCYQEIANLEKEIEAIHAQIKEAQAE